jgi:hypothetical protein
VGYAVQAQPFNTAADYLGFLVKEQNAVVFKNMEYVSKSVHSDNPRAVDAKRNEVLAQIRSSQSRIRMYSPFKGGEQMKEDALKVFASYLEIFQRDFKEANDLKTKSENSYEAMELYLDALERAEQRLASAIEEYDKAQETYAAANNITLTQANSKFGETIRQVNELNKYKNEIFLIQFRTSKAKSRVLDAINAQDGDAVENQRLLLAQAAEISRRELGRLQPFKGESVLLDATTQLVQFAEKAADKEIAEMSSILRNAKRTNQDVDRYNKLIKEFNENNQKLVNAYNKASDEISRKFVPKRFNPDK